jgi:hypothetical protein
MSVTLAGMLQDRCFRWRVVWFSSDAGAAADGAIDFSVKTLMAGTWD